MTDDTRTVSTWHGRPIADLSREELLDALEWCGRELMAIRSDRDKWRRSGDPLKYLMDRGSSHD